MGGEDACFVVFIDLKGWNLCLLTQKDGIKIK